MYISLCLLLPLLFSDALFFFLCRHHNYDDYGGEEYGSFPNDMGYGAEVAGEAGQKVNENKPRILLMGLRRYDPNSNEGVHFHS
jgi:hypothetical protein